MLWQTWLRDGADGGIDRDDEFRHLITQALATPEGRALAWFIIVISGPGQQSHVALSSDTTAFNEGLRSVGATLLARMDDLCPGSTRLMEDEARERSVALEERLAVSGDDDVGSF